MDAQYIKKMLSEKWVEILTITAAVIAIIIALQANKLAKQANEIARRQITSSISIAGTWEIERQISSDQNIIYGTCVDKIRLQNNGGATSTIVDYHIDFAVGNDFLGGVVINSEQGEGHAPSFVSYESEGKKIKPVEVYIANENTVIPTEFSEAIEAKPLPIALEPFGSMDLLVITRWYFSPQVNLNTSTEEGYEAVNLIYDFALGSGETVTLPITCWYVQ